MALFLVDFENVRSEGLFGIENLTTDDEVFIFYSENAGTLTFDVHQRIINSSANIYYVEVKTGTKNALDFQLVSYLGYMLREKPDIPYRIISKDRGFEVVVKFWQDKGVDLELTQGIEKTAQKKPVLKSSAQAEISAEQSDNQDVREFLLKILEDEAEREFVEKCIRELTTKSGINNRIAKKYGTTRAGEIYRLIKPLLKDKKG